MADLPEGVEIEPVWLVEVPYTPEGQERRPAHRLEHLARVGELLSSGRLVEAGGCLDWSKAVLMVRAASADEALALVMDDVYTREGVWHDGTVRAYGRVVTRGPS
jgi:uncharacterized protein YciI